MPDTHAFIGTLAQALYQYNVPICLSTLGKLLFGNGAVPYRNGFDVGSIVAATYAYWVQRDPQTAYAIANVFRSEYGHPVIAANEPLALLPERREA
jgi:hypothetical protein